MSLNLFDPLLTAPTHDPESVALTTPDGQPVTFAKLRQTIEVFTESAGAAGLNAGDHVVIKLDNHAVQFCLMVALSRLGVVLMTGDSAHGFQNAGISVDAIISNEIQLNPSPRPIVFSQDWFQPGPQCHSSTDYCGYERRNTLAMICATSGTTGDKKYVPLNYGALVERFALYEKLLNYRPKSSMVTMTFASHIGFNQAMRVMGSGGHFCRPLGTPDLTLKFLSDHGIEELFTTPHSLAGLVAAQIKRPMPLPGLKHIAVAGSVMSNRLVEQVQSHLCHDITILYGATETGPVVSGQVHETGHLDNAVGRPAPWARVDIVNDEGELQQDGEPGAIRVSVPAQLRALGYIGSSAENGRKASEETRTESGDWIYTGDWGLFTEDGVLLVEGRVDDRINLGGNKLSPAEVEEIIGDVEDVSEVGVFGLPNTRGYHDIGVAVVGNVELNTREIADLVRGRIGRTIVVRVEQIDALPTNEADKVDRNALRKFFESSDS